jgi:Domain of unknown function (DUF1772)
MKEALLGVDYAVLLACAAMYFGTGWSLLLFSFPVAPQLTPENYYLQFVPQVHAATRFFKPMTAVMLGAAGVMLIAEWGRALVWVPVVVILAVVAATVLTVRLIFPVNAVMDDRIEDQGTLDRTLGRWMFLNRVRTGLWTVEFVAMAVFFAVRAR